jgi:hypothetical protein
VRGVDLVTFLRTRLDEREAAARKCAEVGDFHWVEPNEEDPDGHVVNGRGQIVVWDVSACLSAHIALNDPAFVLADVAAKRRILSDVYEPLRELESAIRDENDTGEDPSINWHEVSDRLLRALAAPFAQHPDFDPAWAVPGEQS